MRMESERRHQETLAMVQETAHERIDFNLNHVSNLIPKSLALSAYPDCPSVHERLQQGPCFRSSPAAPRGWLLVQGKTNSPTVCTHFEYPRTCIDPPDFSEISDLMRFKSQHGPGGEFDPTWSVTYLFGLRTSTDTPNRQGPTGRDCPIPSSEAPIPAPEVMEVSPDPHILPAEEVPVAKPATAWRTNQKRKLTKRGGQGGATPRDTVVEYAEQVAPETVLPMPIPTPMPISVHPTSVSGAKDSWASWDRESESNRTKNPLEAPF